MRIFFTLLLTLSGVAGALAQVASPEQFLGYPLGSRFTPHYKIVNYVYQVARQAPDRVKVEEYGQTNEGRPLLLVYVASKENLPNLESIRNNSLMLAGLATIKGEATDQTPAIV